MAALRPRKFDIAQSNLIEIGVEFEKKLKLVDTEQDTRWKGAGKEVGLQIWRVERYKVIPWAKENYGHFFSSDCYIVLKTSPKPADPKAFLYDAHFWVGKNASQDEYSTAAFFTIELDDHLKGDLIQYREVQGFESSQFLSYFKIISFHETTLDIQFNKVAPKEYKARLLHLKGTRNVIAREVPIKLDSLNSGDVYILDNGLDIYTFKGREAGGMERAKADEIGRAMVKERGGAPQLYVFDEDDTGEAAKKFWSFFGGQAPIAPATPDAPPASTRRMFRLSDETGRMLFREVTPYGKDKLDANDAFIVDAGDAVFIWVGKGASEEERKQGLAYATDYIFKNNKPKSLPVARFKEGAETEYFWSAFD